MRAGYGWVRAMVAPVAGAMLVVACAGNGSQEESERAERNVASGAAGAGVEASPILRRTIVFVGTSLTAGLGLDPEESVPSLLAGKLDSAGLAYEVVNAGSSGETSAGALRRIDWILRQPMDVLVIETGANDGLRGVMVDSVRANIQGIIDRVRAAKPGVEILLVQMEAPPNFGPRYTSEFRALFPSLAEENDITLLPFLLEDVAGRAELNQGDGMHPNAEGARVAAETLWRALEPILAEGAGD